MKTEAALTAKAIRKELKEKYPKTKFSVKSKTYSGGDSVDIDYVDGPTSNEVKQIVDKYQFGNFDGMYDIYNYDNLNPDVPQTKFVFVHREMSEQTKKEVQNEVYDNYFLDDDMQYHRLVRETFSQRSY